MEASETNVLHPDEKTKLGSLAKRLKGLAVLGAIALAGSVAWGATYQDGFGRFMHGYLVAFCFVLSFALGGLFFVILQHLVKATWSVTVRRIAEILASRATFTLLGLLWLGIAIPLALGSDVLYIWANDTMAHTHHIHAKSAYLNPAFFLLRGVIYFSVWWFLAGYFGNKSVEQDESGDPAISARLRVVSAPAIIAFGFTTCFAAFDLLMSMHPEWYSTMFGVYYFAGCAISIFALLGLIGLGLQAAGKLQRSITVEHYHDVGKLMFAFLFFWGYVAFSQFMLIWYANIPEETIWFKYRMFGGQWKWVSIFLLVGGFVLPFPALMSRWSKRILGLLVLFSLWLLFIHYVDLYWQVIPEYEWQKNKLELVKQGSHALPVVKGKVLSGALFMDLACVIGMLGLFFGVAAMKASKVRLIPIKDPGLRESLKFENY